MRAQRVGRPAKASRRIRFTVKIHRSISWLGSSLTAPKLISVAGDTLSEFEAYGAVDDTGQVWKRQSVSDHGRDFRIEWEPNEPQVPGERCWKAKPNT